MAFAAYFVFFFLSHQLLLSFSEEHDPKPRCSPFRCGHLGYIGFPFSNPTHPECGLFKLNNCTSPHDPTIQLVKNEPFFYVREIASDNMLKLGQQMYETHDNHTCTSFINMTLPLSSFISFDTPYKSNLLKCPRSFDKATSNISYLCNSTNYSIFYYNSHSTNISSSPPIGCSVIPRPVTKTQKRVHFSNLYTGHSFLIKVNVNRECYECHWRGGQCENDIQGKFHCSNAKAGNHKQIIKLRVRLGIGIGVMTLLIVSICVTWRYKKGKYVSPNTRFTSSDSTSKSDLEAANAYFGVPIFSYSELADATNNFNQENELGDGGFGIVYHGKLKDGREVAVKRLYEHNYRRVEQFMNEIEILTLLRHKNLVLLYGCTSRHSQGLLLVYEFISNGTVADHLHGGRANSCLLTWSIRMNIAIETASALAYLHASDVIHRDVKTNNILLDNNFCVKVADFGLSKLFPIDVTHVSTTPQGTPGYVDPEYHQCYQLTDKSDVYSFGVVLIELVSSMPAVDISRHKNEINLANLAINRIQEHAVDELIDPCLGSHFDEEVKRMTTSVAELAFLCLQQNKEMRPTMDVVLRELEQIKNRGCKPGNLKEDDVGHKEELKSMQQSPPSTPHCEETALLKNIQLPPSPISVTENWVSNTSTCNGSS